VTQMMTIIPVLAVALFFILSFVVWKVRLEHRRYEEYVRQLDKRIAKDAAHLAATAQEYGAVHRISVQQHPRPDRAGGQRRSAAVRVRRFRVVES